MIFQLYDFPLIFLRDYLRRSQDKASCYKQVFVNNHGLFPLTQRRGKR